MFTNDTRPQRLINDWELAKVAPESETFWKQSRRMLCNMIEQHVNRPWVIIRAQSNKNDWPGDLDTFDQYRIHAFMKELHDLSPSLTAAGKRESVVQPFSKRKLMVALVPFGTMTPLHISGLQISNKADK